MSEWSAGVIVDTVRPQTDNQITLYPAEPTLQKHQITTSGGITMMSLEHTPQTTWPWVWCHDVLYCEFSSPVVHFGGVIAGDVALISCGWWTDFPPLSLTVTHNISSDNQPDQAVMRMRRHCVTAHLLWQNVEPLSHSDSTVTWTSGRIVVQGHHHESTAVCTQIKTTPLVQLV